MRHFLSVLFLLVLLLPAKVMSAGDTGPIPSAPISAATPAPGAF